jgi:hypothetical protein
MSSLPERFIVRLLGLVYPVCAGPDGRCTDSLHGRPVCLWRRRGNRVFWIMQRSSTAPRGSTGPLRRSRPPPGHLRLALKFFRVRSRREHDGVLPTAVLHDCPRGRPGPFGDANMRHGRCTLDGRPLVVTAVRRSEGRKSPL